MKWSRLLVTLSPVAGIFGLLYGCSTSDRPAASSGEGTAPSLDETCATEGATRDCHELLSIHEGVKECVHGTQTCVGGRWSTCGGSGTLEATNMGLGIPNLVSPTPAQVGQLKMLTIGSGTTDATACSNPCDPACAGYDQDAGPLYTDASLNLDAVTGVVATPPGFVDKLLRDNTTGWGADCEKWNTGNAQTGWAHSSCMSDYYCQRDVPSGTTKGNCVQFSEGANETHAAKVAGTTNDAVSCIDSAPDLTLSTPCGLGGYVVVPICNRGTAAVPSGTTITVAEEPATLTAPAAPTNTNVPTGSGDMSGCPTYTTDCNITLAADLAPGACVRFVGAPPTCSSSLNGNKSLYVNSSAGIKECVMGTHILGPEITVGSPTVEQSNQYGCANNYTDFNATQIPTCLTLLDPKTIQTDVFSPTCRPDQHVQWGTLGWNASTPGASSITFEARVRERYIDGGVGPWTSWVQAGYAKQSTSPPDDPQVCSMTGPSPCPKDLFTPLGGIPQARYEDIQLQITLTPSGILGPVLYAYYLAYSCVDAE